MKKYYKYILWVVAFYFITQGLIFIAFNSNYKPIQLRESLPQQISVEKAEATKSQGRIYGYIQNSEQNYLNGKYLKLTVFDSENKELTTKYTKIDIISPTEKKAFEIQFIGKESTSYELNIVDKQDIK